MKFKGRCVKVMLAVVTKKLKMHDHSNMIKIVSFLAGRSLNLRFFYVVALPFTIHGLIASNGGEKNMDKHM